MTWFNALPGILYLPVCAWLVANLLTSSAVHSLLQLPASLLLHVVAWVVELQHDQVNSPIPVVCQLAYLAATAAAAAAAAALLITSCRLRPWYVEPTSLEAGRNQFSGPLPISYSLAYFAAAAAAGCRLLIMLLLLLHCSLRPAGYGLGMLK
jgi:hypothetical protein